MVPRPSITMSSRCLESDEDSSSSTTSETSFRRSPLSELALRLQQRVAMEHQALSSGQTTYRPSVEELLFQEDSRDITVKIEGMDLLFHALRTSIEVDSVRSRSTSSDSCGSHTQTSDEMYDLDSKARNIRTRRRRCQFRNRQNIGAHLHLNSELTVDSLQLAHTCMKTKRNRDEKRDTIHFESIQLDDGKVETTPIKNVSKNSWVIKGSLSSRHTALENPYFKRVGNAAA